MSNIPQEATEHGAEVAKYLAKRRRVLPTDAFITDHDGVDERGHKYREETVRGAGGTSETIESDLTAMYQNAPSTTGDLDILLIEAELLDDGADLDNPHVPASEELMKQARRKIEAEGLTPAWEHGL